MNLDGLASRNFLVSPADEIFSSLRCFTHYSKAKVKRRSLVRHLTIIVYSLKTDIKSKLVFLRRPKSELLNDINRISKFYDFIVSRGKQISTKNKESIQANMLKQKQHSMDVAVGLAAS